MKQDQESKGEEGEVEDLGKEDEAGMWLWLTGYFLIIAYLLSCIALFSFLFLSDPLHSL